MILRHLNSIARLWSLWSVATRKLVVVVVVSSDRRGQVELQRDANDADDTTKSNFHLAPQMAIILAGQRRPQVD